MVICIFLVSVIYKQQNNMIFTHFPIQEQDEIKVKSTKASLYLFLFFSIKKCPRCLSNVVEVLNGLSSNFIVVGVIPGNELEAEKKLRSETGAIFTLSSLDNYKKYAPIYTPTLIGVSPTGKVVFILPVDTLRSRYLKDFLNSVYSQLYHLLGDEKAQDQKGDES